MAITPGTDVTIQDEPLPRGPIVEPSGGISRQFFNWFQGKDRKLGEIISGVNLNRQNIVQLEVDYQAADGTLSNAYIAADAVVFANSEASNAALSTTLTAAYQSADTALQGQITTNAGNITTAQADITTLFSTTATNGSAISTLQTNLSAEVTNRTNADTNLQGQITTNAGNITTNSANITTLQSASATNTSAIATLQTNLSAETTNRTNADTNLQGQITTNAGAISVAQADITTLQSASTTNTSAIATLQTNLSAEVTNRTNADTNLQGQITTNSGNISTNSANITTLQSTTATNTSAISTLTTNLSAEVTNRTNADTALQGQITTNAGNITTNAAAITTEAAARASGDAANATSITNLTATFGKTTKQLIVDNFNNDGFYWTQGFGGAPENVADPVNFTYTDVASIGRVAQLSAFNTYTTPKAAIKPYVGMKLRLEAKVRATVDPTSGQINVGYFLNGLSSAWAHGNASFSQSAVPTYNGSKSGLTVADGWITLAEFQTCTAISTYDAGWRPRLDLTHTGSGGTVQVAYFKIQDVTETELVSAAVVTEASARASGDSANASLITTLEAKVDTKARTFVQTSAPVATATGDLWVDSDDDNKLYRWNGSSWVAVDDGRIATKTRTFAQTSAPTATATGDLWVDTDDDNKLYRWNGSSWVAVDDQRIGTLSASVTNIAEAYATNDSATARLVWKVNTSTNAATIEQTAATGYSDGTWNGSAIKLSANLIELLAEDINFGTNTTYEDTYATLYTEKNNKRLRILGPFPAADDLVLWFGPTTVSLNSETKTNGHFCLATDGKVYFGASAITSAVQAAAKDGSATGVTTSGTTWVTAVTIDMTVGSGGVIEIPYIISIAGVGITLSSGSSFAGNYRIMEATQAAPSTKSQLFSGTFSVVDTGGGLFVVTLVAPGSFASNTYSGDCRYTLELQRASGVNDVGGGGIDIDMGIRYTAS